MLNGSVNAWRNVEGGNEATIFYFLVYRFLGCKNGSLGLLGKNKEINNYIGPIVSSCRKKLHGNSDKKWCFKETTSFLFKIHCHKSSHTTLLPRYLKKQRKYLEAFSSRCCVIKN